MESKPDYIPEILTFLERIDIQAAEGSIPDDTFLPGILIKDGGLLFDRQKLLYPGDLLHEAGHIAVTRAAERATLHGNVTEQNPAKEGEEIVVLLWTYAACLEMGIPAEVVFHPQGYKGESEWLLTNFRSGTYIGLPLLVWMGLSTTETFPRMTCWLRG